jgi:hypothetical protein
MNSMRDGKKETVPPPLIERRGSMCPSCKQVRGEAFNIAAHDHQKTVSYRCPSCDRTWDHTRPDPLPM